MHCGRATKMEQEDSVSAHKLSARHELDQTAHRLTFVDRVGDQALEAREESQRIDRLSARYSIRVRVGSDHTNVAVGDGLRPPELTQRRRSEPKDPLPFPLGLVVVGHS